MCPPPPGARLLACCILAGSLLPAQPARAYEDQASLGLRLGYAYFATERPLDHGAAAALVAGLGLSEVWTARATARYSWHPGDQGLHRGELGASLLYLIDVIELVPYGGAGLGGALGVYGGDPRVDATAHGVLGVDYLYDWEGAVGLQVRADLALTALKRDPLWVTVTLGWRHVFDFY